MARKKIYIANTGGTIGMKKTTGGYTPEPGYLETLLKQHIEFQAEGMPQYHIHDCTPLLDSASMSPDNWLAMAKDITARHTGFDGFVLLHGTDTMAYTASALSFLLDGLEKPVILTGGQIPLCETRNDSLANLVTAMQIAAYYNIPEVCLFFNHRLLRGNRSVKIDANAFMAFDSPNFSPLGKVGIDIRIHWDRIRPMPHIKKDVVVPDLKRSRVAALRFFPGISAEIMKNIMAPPLQGLVLETYGVGNGPTDNPKLMAAIEGAVKRGVTIVNCTQCLRGRVAMQSYTAGKALRDVGVISGLDMTTEAALAKMVFLFGCQLDVSEVREKLQSNLCGELSEE